MSGKGPKKRLPELGRANGCGFLSKSNSSNNNDGSPLKHCLGGTSPRRPSSPEPNCSICLGGIEEQSFANKCFHSFCRTCLFEWSKVKPECPVCRQGFDSIIFNVKAMDDYEEYTIPQPITQARLWADVASVASVGALLTGAERWPEARGLANNLSIFRRRVIHLQEMISRGRTINSRESGRTRGRLQFLYTYNAPHSATSNAPSSGSLSSTTQPPPRAHESSSRSRTSTHSGLEIDFADVLRHVAAVRSHPPVGTCAHRRYIYENDLWVQPLSSRLERECSSAFYRNNPAVVHRLLPFLNRELNAILRPEDEPFNQSTESLMTRIKAALFEYDIPSIQFRQVVEPYVQEKTHHFLHELFYFAKSPHTIEDYNHFATYVPRARAKPLKLESVMTRPAAVFTNQDDDSSSSTDDSVIELIDSDQDVPPFSSNNQVIVLSKLSKRITNLSSSDSSTDLSPQSKSPAKTSSKPSSDQKELLKAIKHVQKVSKEMDSQATAIDELSFTPSTSPSAPSASSAPSATMPAVPASSINMIDDFDNPRPGPSGLCRSNVFVPITRKQYSDNDGSDTEVDIESTGKDIIHKTKKIKSTNKEDDSAVDSDDSIKVVGVRKPIHERTPEIIDISSSNESDKKESNKQDNEKDVNASENDNDEAEPKRKKVKLNENGSKRDISSDKDSDDSDIEIESSTKKRVKKRKKRKQRHQSHKKKHHKSLSEYRRKYLSTGSDSDSSSSDTDVELTELLSTAPKIVTAPTINETRPKRHLPSIIVNSHNSNNNIVNNDTIVNKVASPTRTLTSDNMDSDGALSAFIVMKSDLRN